MATYETINGQRVAPAVARNFRAMAKEFKRVFGLDLIISSGVRSRAEQQRLYDGWVARKPGFNLALHPDNPLAYHVESNPKGQRAIDIRDSGADFGVTRVGTKRANWIVQNAHRWGFDPAGYRFRPQEAWHLEYRGNPWEGAVAGAVKKPIKKAVNAVRYPKVSVANLGRIGDVRGLQKIARLGGYRGRIDNQWGKGSQAGFSNWLRSSRYGTVANWLRRRWGYVGDDYLGPVMTKALRRANAENNRVL